MKDIIEAVDTGMIMDTGIEGIEIEDTEATGKLKEDGYQKSMMRNGFLVITIKEEDWCLENIEVM